MGPKSNDKSLAEERAKSDIQRRRPREDGGRDGSDSATNQGMLRIADNTRSWERGLGGFSRVALRRRQPCQHLHLGRRTPTTVRQDISVESITQCVGNVLPQPQDSDTSSFCTAPAFPSVVIPLLPDSGSSSKGCCLIHGNKTSINEKLKEFKYERPGSSRNPSLGKWLRRALCRRKRLFSPLPLSAASQPLEKEWGVSQTPDRKARRVTPPWKGTQLHLSGTCLTPHPFLLPSLPA